MDQEQLKIEHRQRIVEALTLGIRHAAQLCPSIKDFIEEVISKDALDRADLNKIRDRKRGLGKAEQNLLSTVETLYRIHASNAWIASRDFEGLLLLLWNGVGETLDIQNRSRGLSSGYGDELQVEEQRYQDAVVRPRI